MKKLSLIICFLIISTVTVSQDVTQLSIETKTSDEIKHTIHADVGTLFFWGFTSINYELTLREIPEKNIIRFRTGIIYMFGDNFYGVPLNVTTLFGKNNKYFELTAGVAIGVDLYEDSARSGGSFQVYPLIDIGFRKELWRENFFYRIKIGSSGLGFGLGYAF